jgi:hypothetical protein
MAIPVSSSETTLKQFKKILSVCVVETKKTEYQQRKEIRCMENDKEADTLWVPMGVWPSLTKKFPWKKKDYPKIEGESFRTLLTPKTDPKGTRDQTKVFGEILDSLEEHHTAFLAAHTGYGKCFDPETLVMTHSRSPKRVADLVVGDLLFGDDTFPREVVSLARGREEMFEVCVDETYMVCPFETKSTSGETKSPSGERSGSDPDHRPGLVVMKCNRSHILSVKEKYSGVVMDLSLEEYLAMKTSVKDTLHLFGTGCLPQGDIPTSILRGKGRVTDPALQEKFFGMGYSLALLENLPNLVSPAIDAYCMGVNEWARERDRTAWIEAPSRNIRGPFPQFWIDLPVSVSVQFVNAIRRLGVHSFVWGPGRDPVESPSEIIVFFEGTIPFTVKSVGEGDYMGFTLRGSNSRFLLANGIVAHNTTIGINLACHLGLKTAVLCHLDLVNQQWVKNFSKHTSLRVQHLGRGGKCGKGATRGRGKEGIQASGKKKPFSPGGLDPDADVYVMGINKASRLSRDELKDIGFVILDEAHISTVEAFTKSLLKFVPYYVLGLSATPERADGLHSILRMYFGSPENFIIREEVKDFTVYKVETDIKPTVEYQFRGGRNSVVWTSVINSLAYSPKRHALIADWVEWLLTDFENEKPLVLTNRIEEAQAIHSIIEERGYTSILIVGAKKPPKDAPKYQVQVMGMKKGGAGYDDPTRTSVIICDDATSVKQYEGRIRKNNNMVIDFVDCYPTLERHWGMREEWYLKRGATIIVDPRKTVLKVGKGSGKKPLRIAEKLV